MAFDAQLNIIDNVVEITLSGDLDGSTAPILKEKIETAAQQNPQKLVLIMKELEYMSSAGLRVLIFSKQKMGSDVDIYVVGPQEMVVDTITKTGFHHSVFIVEELGAVEMSKA